MIITTCRPLKLSATLWQYSKLILFLTALASSSELRAQELSLQADTVRWSATGFEDLLSNVTAEGPCQFITYGDQRADWVQDNGNFVISFVARTVSGSWQNLNSNGSVTLGLAFDALTGQIVLSRTDLGITAEITINGGSVPIKNSYSISSIEKL